MQKQQYEMAINFINSAIQINDKNPYYFSNLGIAQLEAGRCHDSVDSFSRALSLNPALAQVSFNMGNAYSRLHRHTEAVKCYLSAIDLDDLQFTYHLNLGNSYRDLGNFSLALDSYQKALTLVPDDSSVWLNKGLCLQVMNEHSKAIECFRNLVKLNPKHWNGHWTLGRLSMILNKWEDAIVHLTQASEGLTESPELWNDLGIALDKTGNQSESVVAFEMALALEPNFYQVHNNLGAVLHGMQKFRNALHHFDVALEINSDYKNAQVNKAFTQLLTGNLEDGFRNYECRDVLGNFKPPWLSEKPEWNGHEGIHGKRLLVYAEQGFGDSIQFARYLELMSKSGAYIVFAVQKSLIPLFVGNIYLSDLIDLNSEYLDFDFHVSLLSLPHLLGADAQTILTKPAYLKVENDVSLRWKTRFEGISKPRIGLVWSGSVTHINDANRSLPLRLLLPHLPADFNYITLQTEIRASDRIDLCQSKIISFENKIGDFQDTAAICQQLDLIITVDTSVAHLSASLSCPTWLLLPYTPDWRWFLNSENSPWYSSLRLFRQEKNGDWDSVLQKMNLALISHFD